MTDEDIRKYIDSRLQDELAKIRRSLTHASLSSGASEPELADLEFQVKAMIELLTKLVPGFDQEAIDKTRIALEKKQQADAEEAAGGLMGKNNL